MTRLDPIAKAPATYQDVLDAPEHLVAELIDGALLLHPCPASPHALAGSSLGDEIMGPFHKGRGGPGGWWILDAPELHLGAHVLVPALAGWRRSQTPVFPDVPFFEQAPSWVCEVLSPSTRRHDLTRKRDLYGEHGVALLWFVDPLARTLEAFEVRHGAGTLLAALADDDPVSVPPFDAIAFDLAALWPPEPEPEDAAPEPQDPEPPAGG